MSDSEESMSIIEEPNENLSPVVDMNDSFSEYSVDVKPQVNTELLSMLHRSAPPPPIMVVEQQKKPAERPVKHRNNGKISIANLARRRLLSVSADSANEYFRELRLNEQQNRPPPVQRTPNVPLQRPAPATTATIIVRSTFNSQVTSAVAMGQDDPDGVASSVANSLKQEEEQPQQSHPPQQQQQQSQQIQELIRLINTETFCIICQLQYASRQGLKQHQKSQKHQKNTQNMDLPRQRLLEQALAQARANNV